MCSVEMRFKWPRIPATFQERRDNLAVAHRPGTYLRRP
ncbi:hypothetical protein APY03_2464 [Variovorax sp. WDL1]|nr:hypothetical protein APY03_2464 [Variovorax sp. WDL1]